MRIQILLCLSLAVVFSVVSKKFPRGGNVVLSEYLEREGMNPNCEGCSRVRALLDKRLPDFNLTDVRIEMAKSVILKKLGLEKAPTTQFKHTALPNPVAEGNIFKNMKDRKPPKKRKISTERIVVLTSEMSCTIDSTAINLKMKFDIPKQVRSGEVSSAILWLFTDTTSFNVAKMSSCVLSWKPCEIPISPGNKVKMISLQASDSRDGWIEKDVTWAFQEKEPCYSYKIACPPDSSNLVNCSRYKETNKKSFLLIDVVSEELVDVSRDKRNVNCIEGVNECCREKLYVSFSDIGWGNWIIQPRGYEAYYCKGTCANAAAISLSATPYHSVLKKLFLTHGHALHITPCCTPTRLSSVQLIYMDKNETLIQKTIQDLTVESCGCM